MTPAGIISTVAGTGVAGFSGDGGPATSAQTGAVSGVAVDGSGNLYIADGLNNRIRKVNSAGIISTVAGSGATGFGGDGGRATEASLYFPNDVAVDGSGNLYIADAFNLRVRKVTPDGIVSTAAGTGVEGFSGDGGLAISAQMRSVSGVAADGSGDLYIADSASHRIRRVTAAGIISTVAGTGLPGLSGDGGPATSASLNTPYGMAVDGLGNLYIADASNQIIRKVTAALPPTLTSITDAGGQSSQTSKADGIEQVVSIGIAEESPDAKGQSGTSKVDRLTHAVSTGTEVHSDAKPILEEAAASPAGATNSLTIGNTGGVPRTDVTALTSGASRTFTLPAVTGPTLFNANYSYSVSVPAGTSRLDVVLTTATANTDVDLYVRFGQDVVVSNGSIVADFKSEGLAGSESITVTSPAAGTYYIAFGVFTLNTAITSTVTATATSATPPPTTGTGPRSLTSGTPATFTLPAVTQPTLYSGDYSYKIVVPPGTSQLVVRLTTATANANVDLYARLGQDVALSAGNVVRDYTSAGTAGDETITVTSPAAGTYYIAFGVFTLNTAITSTITATATSGTPPPTTGTGPRSLTSGTPATFTVPAVTQPTLYNGDYSYKIVVPSGSSQLVIRLTTATANADIDLYARFGQDVALSGGSVVRDFSSEGIAGSETITVDSPQAGTYYIAFGVFTLNTAITSTVTATSTGGTSGTGPRSITSGAPATFTVPAVTQPTLYNGDFSFKIVVPPGAS